ncbi:LacI family DNA-binding transcriptional regulator [Terribacillus sp. 7520-G]|uniref:LacI family DNA-binding transcriptional regulator n=1 Tax=Terribacillus TaxID=459532 RepID=UPI000BA54330|nr:LacI family DNA-binding transcriptional regulator [Terribacillus sp. 7520-G]PAD37754.1 LacI family transcriptional regulator [Terribacillus sp. 7520-G]
MATIKDLAKLAGVSVTTVSRVLNDHPYVSEGKRKAVLEAIKQTKYEKNVNAVHLKTGKTQLIGVVLPFSDHPYFGQLLKGIAKQAFKHNYKLVLIQTDYQEKREKEALHMLRQKQIDALIICSRSCDLDLITSYTQYGPIVVGEKANGDTLSSAYIDHYQAFQDALAYLYESGHRKIGYSVSRLGGTSSKERAAAYRDFLAAKGLPYRLDYVFDKMLYFEDGKRLVNQIRRLEDPPSALIITNDQVAAGVMTCAGRVGMHIPEKLAIIGFDDHPMAQMMGITSMHIPLEEMGEHLFKQAVEKESKDKVFRATLRKRETVQ